MEDLFGSSDSEPENEEITEKKEVIKKRDNELVSETNREEKLEEEIKETAGASDIEEKDIKAEREETEGEKEKEIQYRPPEELEYFQLPKPYLDSKLYYVRLTNILGLITKPFDPNTYEEEVRTQEEEDEGIKKAPLPEAMRWRFSSEDTPKRESNSRFVRWEDGTIQLFVGSEVYDVATQDISQENNYLFVRQKQFIKCHGTFESKLNFRPYSLGSKSHQKLTNSIVQRHKKERKIKLHIPQIDPEFDKQRKEQVEDERIKAKIKLEQERQRKNRKNFADELSSNMLEEGYHSEELEEEYDNQEEGNIGVIKSKNKKKRESKKSVQEKKKKKQKEEF